jgi:hypothetical protein
MSAISKEKKKSSLPTKSVRVNPIVPTTRKKQSQSQTSELEQQISLPADETAQQTQHSLSTLLQQPYPSIHSTHSNGPLERNDKMLK